MKKVWSATLTSFEHSLQHHDFPEFKQAANLQVQVSQSSKRLHDEVIC